MAHSLSAKKRIRQNAKHRSRNRWRKRQVKEAITAFDDAVRQGSPDQAQQQLRLCYKRLDKIASSGAVHKNAAARKKARLTKRLNKAFA